MTDYERSEEEKFCLEPTWICKIDFYGDICMGYTKLGIIEYHP